MVASIYWLWGLTMARRRDRVSTMNNANRKQLGNKITVSHKSAIGELSVECYEIRNGQETFVGHMYPGMAAAWLAS